ncbi:MAG: hypothetical protein ABEJ02_04670 [Candidatus Paceibacteria bacterium]
MEDKMQLEDEDLDAFVVFNLEKGVNRDGKELIGVCKLRHGALSFEIPDRNCMYHSRRRFSVREAYFFCEDNEKEKQEARKKAEKHRNKLVDKKDNTEPACIRGGEIRRQRCQSDHE